MNQVRFDINPVLPGKCWGCQWLNPSVGGKGHCRLFRTMDGRPRTLRSNQGWAMRAKACLEAEIKEEDPK